MRDKQPYIAIIEVYITKGQPIEYTLRKYGTNTYTVKGALETVKMAAAIAYPGKVIRAHPRKAGCWLVI